MECFGWSIGVNKVCAIMAHNVRRGVLWRESAPTKPFDNTLSVLKKGSYSFRTFLTFHAFATKIVCEARMTQNVPGWAASREKKSRSFVCCN
jgi:hypothetical protein